eukprot:12882260-Prorocentrum_lima.AAC.1
MVEANHTIQPVDGSNPLDGGTMVELHTKNHGTRGNQISNLVKDMFLSVPGQNLSPGTITGRNGN